MLKISITLPNNAQINLESEDAAVIDKILGMVLLDITRNIMISPAESNGKAESAHLPAERAALVYQPDQTVPESKLQNAPMAAAVFETAPETATSATATKLAAFIEPYGDEDVDNDRSVSEDDSPEDEDGTEGQEVLGLVGGTEPLVIPIINPASEQAFIEFCRAHSPLGDMRRVVVAAEGASRFLGMNGVDAVALGRLFDLAGWPQAPNFVHTLRNSARSKFRWLERLPGRAGYYSVTDLGRATALSR
jgi:hypothetical protein